MRSLYYTNFCFWKSCWQLKIRHVAQKSKIPKIGRLAYACMVSRVLWSSLSDAKLINYWPFQGHQFIFALTDRHVSGPREPLGLDHVLTALPEWQGLHQEEEGKNISRPEKCERQLSFPYCATSGKWVRKTLTMSANFWVMRGRFARMMSFSHEFSKVAK